jgi:hypothetical protein
MDPIGLGESGFAASRNRPIVLNGLLQHNFIEYLSAA